MSQVLLPLCCHKRRCGRIAPYFPLSHGIPRVDDRRVISGIIFTAIKARMVCAGAMRRRTIARTRPIYNRFIRWSELGVFNRIFGELARAKVQSLTG